jgi:two-component system phosphate regulon sensor histidine kinase PhoR
MQRRIRWRIALPYLILLVVMMTVFGLLTVNHIRQEEQILWQTQWLRTARLLAAQARDQYNTQGETLRLTNLARQSAETLAAEITFYDPSGILLGSSLEEQRPANPTSLPEISSAITNGEGVQLRGQQLSVAVAVKSLNGDLLGVLQLQAPQESFQSNLSRVFWLALAVITISAASVVLIALLVSDMSLKPVEALTTAAQQMSLGNFKNIEIPEAPLELGDLSRALRIMAVQLGAQIDALTSERAKLSAVLNQMTDGVMIADSDGRVQLLNPAAERLFQIKETAGLGRSVVEVMRYHQLVELWQKAKQGRRQSTTLEIGPQHLFLQVVGTPLKTALPGSTMLLFQDLTQLRRLETVRRDFISNVSHELRTPLASLKALAETLQEGALEDPPAARRFIIRMETEIDNLTQLVNELLELSRIESGKVALSFQRIGPCQLLMPAIERMALQAERAGLVLTLDCQDGLPQVFADPDRITQVMINLIHNAVKFTPPGGKISASAYQDGDHIVFFVRDSGVGIAKKDLARIFERFYKADRARTGGGTGLGLSIARHMIESHGGYIWAESEEDVGSTFYFTLPIA